MMGLALSGCTKKEEQPMIPAFFCNAGCLKNISRSRGGFRAAIPL
jgi:hypothetical protein